MKGTQLFPALGLLCAVSCLINWLAVQQPNGGKLMIGLYALLIISEGIAVVFDDPIARLMGKRTEEIHLMLAFVMVSAVVGGCWVWLNV